MPRAETAHTSIPVIMLTARGAERDITASFRGGAVFHIEKPFEAKELLEKIQIAYVVAQEGSHA